MKIIMFMAGFMAVFFGTAYFLFAHTNLFMAIGVLATMTIGMAVYLGNKLGGKSVVKSTGSDDRKTEEEDDDSANPFPILTRASNPWPALGEDD